jgi:hypothetical protein
VAAGSVRGVAAGSVRGVAAGSVRGVVAGSVRGVVAGSLPGVVVGAGWRLRYGVADDGDESADWLCTVAGNPGIAAAPGMSARAAAVGPEGPAPGALPLTALPGPACCGDRLPVDIWVRTRGVLRRADCLLRLAPGAGALNPGISALPGVRACVGLDRRSVGEPGMAASPVPAGSRARRPLDTRARPRGVLFAVSAGAPLLTNPTTPCGCSGSRYL